MKKKMLRTATTKKINSFLKTAQEEEAPMDDLDELDETMDDLGEMPEEDEELADEAPAEGEEDVTSEVEELEEHVDDLDEKVETVIDGLESQKDILEDLVGDGEFKEDEFADFLEDENDLDEEEITSDEFGVDEDQIASKEGRMSLREKRRARLQSPRRQAADKEEDTISKQWKNEEDRKDRFSPVQPPVTINKVKEDDVPAMLRVSELTMVQSKTKNAWIVLDKNDNPLFLIPQEKIASEEFSKKSFAVKLFREMKKAGIRNTLKKYNAKRYVKAADKTPEELKKEEEAAKKNPGMKTPDAKVDPNAEKKAVQNYQRRFTRAVRLALNAMNKNLVKDVPLKAALFEILSDLDVDEPSAIIEAAFRRAGAPHFEAAIAQAEKYLSMSDEAFVETEAMVGQADVSEVPQFRSQASRKEAEELKRRAANGSIPFSTSTDGRNKSNVEKMQAALPKPKLHNVKHLFESKE